MRDLLIMLAICILIGVAMFSCEPGTRRQIQADRDRCAANLTLIDGALRRYASQNDGRFPVSLRALVDAKLLSATALVCPGADDATATRPTGSYALVAEGRAASAIGPREPVVIEAADCFRDPGIHALFGDGTAPYLEPTHWRGRPTVWWADLQAQLARGDRPIRLQRQSRDAATQPTR